MVVTYNDPTVEYNDIDVTYNGGDLGQTIVLGNTTINKGNFHIRRILHDHIASIDFEADSIARKDGTKVLNTNFNPKTIQIEGRIQDDTNTLEENIDTFKQTINVTQATLDISYASDARRYIVTLASFTINRDFFNINFADYTMEFEVLRADGRDDSVLETLSAGGLTETTTSWEDINFGGTLFPKPLIQYTIDTAGNLDTIQFTQDDTGTEMVIGTSWSDGDTLKIDVDNFTVQRNGSDVEFEGVFPKFIIGDNDFTSTMASANQIDVKQEEVNSTSVIVTPVTFQAQSFKTTVTDDFAFVQILLKNSLSLSGANAALLVQIQTDNAGEPSGTVVTNAISDNVIINSQAQGVNSWWTFNFSTFPNLTSGVQYWLVVIPAIPDEVYAITVPVSISDPYADGNHAKTTNAGLNWDVGTTIDMGFRIYRDIAPSYELTKHITYTKRYL